MFLCANMTTTLRLLLRAGIHVEGELLDSGVAHWLLDPEYKAMPATATASTAAAKPVATTSAYAMRRRKGRGGILTDAANTAVAAVPRTCYDSACCPGAHELAVQAKLFVSEAALLAAHTDARVVARAMNQQQQQQQQLQQEQQQSQPISSAAWQCDASGGSPASLLPSPKLKLGAAPSSCSHSPAVIFRPYLVIDPLGDDVDAAAEAAACSVCHARTASTCETAPVPAAVAGRISQGQTAAADTARALARFACSWSPTRRHAVPLQQQQQQPSRHSAAVSTLESDTSPSAQSFALPQSKRMLLTSGERAQCAASVSHGSASAASDCNASFYPYGGNDATSSAASHTLDTATLTLLVMACMSPTLRRRRLDVALRFVEMPLVRTLAAMERMGVGGDPGVVRKAAALAHERLTVVHGALLDIVNGAAADSRRTSTTSASSPLTSSGHHRETDIPSFAAAAADATDAAVPLDFNPSSAADVARVLHFNLAVPIPAVAHAASTAATAAGHTASFGIAAPLLLKQDVAALASTSALQAWAALAGKHSTSGATPSAASLHPHVPQFASLVLEYRSLKYFISTHVAGLSKALMTASAAAGMREPVLDVVDYCASSPSTHGAAAAAQSAPPVHGASATAAAAASPAAAATAICPRLRLLPSIDFRTSTGRIVIKRPSLVNLPIEQSVRLCARRSLHEELVSSAGTVEVWKRQYSRSAVAVADTAVSSSAVGGEQQPQWSVEEVDVSRVLDDPWHSRVLVVLPRKSAEASVLHQLLTDTRTGPAGAGAFEHSSAASPQLPPCSRVVTCIGHARNVRYKDSIALPVHSSMQQYAAMDDSPRAADDDAEDASRALQSNPSVSAAFPHAAGSSVLPRVTEYAFPRTVLSPAQLEASARVASALRGFDFAAQPLVQYWTACGFEYARDHAALVAQVEVTLLRGGSGGAVHTLVGSDSNGSSSGSSLNDAGVVAAHTGTIDHQHLQPSSRTFTFPADQLYRLSGPIFLPPESITTSSSDGDGSQRRLQRPWSHPATLHLRDALVAAPGCVFLAVDYSQLEIRLLAHFSGDVGLRAILCHGDTRSAEGSASNASVASSQRCAAVDANVAAAAAYAASSFSLRQTRAGVVPTVSEPTHTAAAAAAAAGFSRGDAAATCDATQAAPPAFAITSSSSASPASGPPLLKAAGPPPLLAPPAAAAAAAAAAPSPPLTGDVFMKVASEWLQRPPHSITSAERSITKRVLYGIIYGMSPRSLASQMMAVVPASEGGEDPDGASGAAAAAAAAGVSLEAAARTISSVFRREFPGVGVFLRAVVAAARTDGYVETLMGRRRYLPDINSDDRATAAAAARQAVNTMIQASAADLVKLAMANVTHALGEYSAAVRAADAAEARGAAADAAARAAAAAAAVDSAAADAAALATAASATGPTDMQVDDAPPSHGTRCFQCGGACACSTTSHSVTPTPELELEHGPFLLSTLLPPFPPPLARIVLQMHDELLVEVPAQHARSVAAILSATIEGAVRLSVPVRVNVSVGHRWGTMRELGAADAPYASKFAQ